MLEWVVSGTRESVLHRFATDSELRWWLQQVKYGYRFRVAGLSTLRLEELRVRKEPALLPSTVGRLGGGEKLSARAVCNPIDRFFPIVRGIEDRRIKHLPHVRLLEQYALTGELPRIKSGLRRLAHGPRSCDWRNRFVYSRFRSQSQT